MNVTTKRKVDLQKPDRTLGIDAVQGDAESRYLELSLYSGAVPWRIPEGTTAVVRYRKPDWTGGHYDTMPNGESAWQIQENKLTVSLAPQMLTVPGTVHTQVEMILGTKVLSTFSLKIFVEANPAAGVLVSEDYINWLQWIKDQAREHAQTVEEAAASVQTAADATDANASAAEASAQRAETAANTAGSAAESATEASNKAVAAATEAAAIVAGNEAYTKQESDLRYSASIIPVKNGNTVILYDSAEAPLAGLKLCGKTTQNSVPTPNAPMELVSVGAGGSIAVTITGRTEDNEQTFTVSIPNGLSGIPVTNGGNYIDETGQQWVCDEVDFEKGIHVQRLSTDIGEPTRVIEITDGRQGTETGLKGYRIYFNLANAADLDQRYFAISSAFVWNDHWQYFHTFSINQLGNILMFQVSGDFGITTVEEAKAWITENNVVFLYPLATPIETALSSEELTAYAALRTHYPNTTIFNDAGAGMEIKYLADTKLYVDNKFAALSAALLNNV